tara:strand:+ start:141 stop:509 length:369 start_codon:yes stop_codon:yes gene_type:complete
MSEFKATGRITEVLTKITGQKKDGSGEWVKQEFILDTDEKYNNIFCFELFGEEKVSNFAKYNKIGDQVEVTFNVNCNKWKDRYFTSLSAWKITKAEQSSYQADNEYSAGELHTSEEPDQLPF